MKAFRIFFGLLAAIGALALTATAAVAAPIEAGTVTGAGAVGCPAGSHIISGAFGLNLVSNGTTGSGTGLLQTCQPASGDVTFSCVTIRGEDPKQEVVYASGTGTNVDSGQNEYWLLKLVSPKDQTVPDEIGIEHATTAFVGMDGKDCGAKSVQSFPQDRADDMEITTTGKA
jgi:hypothetical protein